MVLSKRAYAINQNGRWYTEYNIEGLLNERHMAKKARMSRAKNHLKGPSKRTADADKWFREGFAKLIDKAVSEQDIRKNL